MTSIEAQSYICSYCNAESFQILFSSYSIIEPIVYRTDGSCSNHPVFNGSEFIVRCPHCMKFVKNDLEWGTKDEDGMLDYLKVSTCNDILLAIQAPELKEMDEIQYKLRLNYWRERNQEGFYDRSQTDTSKIYSQLLKDWEGHIDERYLFKAELLRNTGKFEESTELLKNPLLQYVSILQQQKKWAKVIKTLNKLKYRKTIEII